MAAAACTLYQGFRIEGYSSNCVTIRNLRTDSILPHYKQSSAVAKTMKATIGKVRKKNAQSINLIIVNPHCEVTMSYGGKTFRTERYVFATPRSANPA